MGEDSESFELYLEDSKEKEINISSEKIKLIINLNNKKDLEGIYLINRGNAYENLDYKALSPNQIELELKSFGKLLIDYKNEIEKQDEKVQEEIPKESNTLIWYVITGIVIALGAIIAIIINKK